MKSSFPKRVKRHSNKWVSNVNTKLVDYVLAKSPSYMCIPLYTSIFTYLWKALPQNTTPELGIDIWNPFSFGMELKAFWKRASHIHLYVYIYIFIHRYINICNFIYIIYIYTHFSQSFKVNSQLQHCFTTRIKAM